MNNIDLIGKKINMLTVIEKMPREKNHRSRYKVLCECGNIKLVDGSKLKNKTVKSCGCYRYTEEGRKNNGKSNRKEYGHSLKNILILSYKNNARKKGYIFELTNDEIEKLFKDNCYYCGREPYKTITKPKLFGSYTYNGIDRLNNNIGYIKENVVSCCSDCNYLKNSYNINEFLNHIRLIYNNTKDLKIDSINETTNQINKCK